MHLFWTLIGSAAAALFYFGIKANAHPLDLHLPTSYDYMLEREYEMERANEEAAKTLNDLDAKPDDIDRALEQLYGPNGDRV